jgi:hypothetical protein
MEDGRKKYDFNFCLVGVFCFVLAFLVGLGFEFRALHLVGRHSTT